MNTDRIEKSVVIRAPRTRVWHALTDAREFGTWFGVALNGSQRFAPGAHLQGQITSKGYEHLTWKVTIERLEPERLLSWRWPHPADDDSNVPTTLVVFELEEVPEGTRLTVVESGFDQLPLDRRAAAHRDNSGGWEIQMEAIAQHVTERPETRPTLASIELAAPIFAALGDQTRLGLVARLGTEGPLSITRLTPGSAVSRQAVTKHLTILAGAGLVHDVHSGRERIWALEPDRLAEVQLYLDQISHQWEQALDRLRQLVEE